MRVDGSHGGILGYEPNSKGLFANTARAMGDAPGGGKIRHIGNCLKADPAYVKGVEDAPGIRLSVLPKGKQEIEWRKPQLIHLRRRRR